MQWLRLSGKTRHGKNRINQHGSLWLVRFEGTFMGHPAWRVSSMWMTEGPKDNKGLDSRWILKQNDPDFEVSEA